MEVAKPDAALVDWLMVLITVLIAFVSLMAWRISQLVAWLTGAAPLVNSCGRA